MVLPVRPNWRLLSARRRYLNCVFALCAIDCVRSGARAAQKSAALNYGRASKWRLKEQVNGSERERGRPERERERESG